MSLTLQYAWKALWLNIYLGQIEEIALLLQQRNCFSMWDTLFAHDINSFVHGCTDMEVYLHWYHKTTFDLLQPMVWRCHAWRFLYSRHKHAVSKSYFPSQKIWIVLAVELLFPVLVWGHSVFQSLQFNDCIYIYIYIYIYIRNLEAGNFNKFNAIISSHTFF